MQCFRCTSLCQLYYTKNVSLCLMKFTNLKKIENHFKQITYTKSCHLSQAKQRHFVSLQKISRQVKLNLAKWNQLRL